MLCGWLGSSAHRPAAAVANAMAHSVRTHAGQQWRISEAPGGLVVAAIVNDAAEADTDHCDPAISPDRRFWLWMAGEAYDGGRLCPVPSTEFTRTRGFREVLLRAILGAGIDAIANLDGRYQVVLFDAVDRRLTLAVDRFGGGQTYWTRSPEGTAFASGVRGVLMAPGVPHEPDDEAIRQAVTFGGFRLGTRTNVRGVERLRGGWILTVDDDAITRPYWKWPPAPAHGGEPPRADLIARAHELWRRAIARRMAGVRRPGQTLSGGLDSRAILAEAAPQAPSWTAITYGVAGCDDARYAEAAAAAAHATWVFHPLYAGSSPDWLERRTSLVQQTDGLVQLADLLHGESLDLQRALFDLHMSGYIGDVVCGTTYDGVVDARTLMSKMPFSGVPIGWNWDRAIAWCADAVAAVAPGAARYAIYEHKFPQAIHLIFQSYAPYVRVRTPFTDYALFDFFAALSDATRAWLYPAWLAAEYPALFRTIPNQSTGLPVLASRARMVVERGRRGAVRAATAALRRAGLPAPAPRVRAYHDEDRQWRRRPFRERIEGTILRQGSLCGDIFGHDALAGTVREFFDRALGPVQVIGALYTFEAYHRDLAAHLRAAAERAAGHPEPAVLQA